MRGKFPIFDKHPDLIYLDSAATTHKPLTVIESLSRFYSEGYGTVHRAIYRSSLAATEKYNETRETVRRFLNASYAEEIIFTRGTTDSINLVATSWGKTHLKPGDEILITEMEHHSNIVPWQLLAEQTGATLRWASINARGEANVLPLINPKTKIVSVAHISNVTGTIQPIRQIADLAHQFGAVLLVDGAQAASHLPVDVQRLDCDFYAFSSHKCYGPTGLGILYGKKELLAAMPPTHGGGDMIEKVFLEKTTYAHPPLRFEAGTPIIGPVIAFKAALDLIESIGRVHIAAHEMALYSALEEGLKKIPHLRLIGQAPEKSSIATFAIEGIHPLDLATLLDLQHIAVRSGHLCAQPCLRAFGLESATRVSFGLYNTLDDVQIFLRELTRAIKKLTS
jgi:cysteine desulfurase/selenocysteine lyase